MNLFEIFILTFSVFLWLMVKHLDLREFYTSLKRTIGYWQLNLYALTFFEELKISGIIYRKESLVNWSCVLQSTISDIEVNHVEVDTRTHFDVPGYKSVEINLQKILPSPIWKGLPKIRQNRPFCFQCPFLSSRNFDLMLFSSLFYLYSHFTFSLQKVFQNILL